LSPYLVAIQQRKSIVRPNINEVTSKHFPHTTFIDHPQNFMDTSPSETCLITNPRMKKVMRYKITRF